MPERSKISAHYQHVKTKQVPLGEGMMNMMNMRVWANSSCLRCHYYRMTHQSQKTSRVCVDTTVPSVKARGLGLAG